MSDLKQAVKKKAEELGFLLVGVTSPEPPQHFDVFSRWLEAGRHGEMGYLAGERSLERRADPRQILPECQSILSLAAPYPSPGDPGQVAPGRGKVAAYAWGDDYHDVLPGLLKALVEYIEAEAGHPVPNRWYTDTGPVLERDLAQRAGLGWIGKNTMLINPKRGSYFLLAEILLGIELEPDPPFTLDGCGSCTRCLDACPTGCILPDRTIDANRCISYLTIELKGSIPEDLRPQVGEWVFGCDVCQQVCPWNRRFAGPSTEASLAGERVLSPRSNVPAPDLVEEIRLTAEEFNQKFKKSPVKRAKRRGYLRSVAVALANCARGGDERAEEALRKAAEDPEPLVREHAAWAYERIRTPKPQ